MNLEAETTPSKRVQSICSNTRVAVAAENVAELAGEE